MRHALTACALLFASGCGSAVVQDLAAGGTRTCARLSDGTVHCWGGRTLPGGSFEGDRTPTPVANVREATAICAGRHFACARVTGGKVKCWGVGAQSEAKEVSGLQDVTALSCADKGGCARGATGDVRCWDWTDEGPGSVTNIEGLTAMQVSVGEAHACAVKDDGTVWCWGDNSDGQLGVAPTAVRTTDAPVQAQGLANVTAVAAGGEFTCALGQDKKVRCFGSNEVGQLGRPGGSSLAPVEVEGLGEMAQVVAGTDHACARDAASAALRCWGRNLNGQLGDGTSVDRNSPVEVQGVTGATTVAAGASHTCALDAETRVLCWGRNLQAQLGDGTHDDRQTATVVTVEP